jgi:hypothetical protein
MGSFPSLAIWSDTIDLEVLIANNTITNLTTGQHCVEFTDAATGMCIGNKMYTDTAASTLDPGSMKCIENYVTTAVDASGVLYPGSSIPTDTSSNFIGADNNNNAAATTNVAANKDGSVLERLEQIMEAVNPDSGTSLAATESLADILYAGNGVATFPAAAAPANGISIAEALRDTWDAVRNGTGGTEPGTNKSVIDAIGSDGAALTDGAVSVVGVLGVNDSNNIFTSTQIAANEDGSVLERLEQIQEAVNEGTGTSLDSNKSIADALGTNGTTLVDDAGSVAGMIGYDDNNNAMATSSVVANEDGSVYERLEGLAVAAAATYNHPNYLAVTADMSIATWNTQAAHEILTATGAIQVKIIVECNTTLEDAGDAATLTLGTENNTAAWIASTSAAGAGDANQLDAGELWLDATPDDNYTAATSSAMLDFVLIDGDDVGYTVGGSAITAGSLVFHMWWYPLDSTGAATAGTGVAL